LANNGRRRDKKGLNAGRLRRFGFFEVDALLERGIGVKLEQEDYSLDRSRFKTAKGCERRLVVRLDQLGEFSRSSCSSLLFLLIGEHFVGSFERR
jgi:hypothetical protein